MRDLLTSGELWGRTGSIVYQSGMTASWAAQSECEHAFGALGEWQIVHGYVSPDVTYWVVFFRERRSLPRQPGRTAVPWSVRDVWLGVLATAAICPAAWGAVYAPAVSSVRLDLDLWVVVVPTLLELLFLVPVWWFTGRKHAGSLKALGFVSFRPLVLGIGIALLFGYFMFSGIYARLLDSLGL